MKDGSFFLATSVVYDKLPHPSACSSTCRQDKLLRPTCLYQSASLVHGTDLDANVYYIKSPQEFVLDIDQASKEQLPNVESDVPTLVIDLKTGSLSKRSEQPFEFCRVFIRRSLYRNGFNMHFYRDILFPGNQHFLCQNPKSHWYCVSLFCYQRDKCPGESNQVMLQRLSKHVPSKHLCHSI